MTCIVWRIRREDGQTVLSASGDGTLRLWDVETGEVLQVFENVSWVESVAYAPDGQTVLSSSWDETLRLWNVKTGALRRVFESHLDVVMSVAFAPDGTRFASGGWEGTVRIWGIPVGDGVLSGGGISFTVEGREPGSYPGGPHRNTLWPC